MFGSMGFMVGGPLGAIAGAALGHHLVDKAPENFGANYGADYGASEEALEGRLENVEQTQAAYFVSMFSILGKLAGTDGAVTAGEAAVAEKVINSLNMDNREKAFARQVFHQAKDSPYTIEDFATQFYQISQGQPTVLLSFLDLLFQIAAADQTLHPAEEAALRNLKSIFRIGDSQFENLKDRYFKDIDKFYKILNCSPLSSNEEIKASYKKLVKDFHPDTIVSKGLPEEFTEFATRRFQEIREAYEVIRKERQL
jgi:DnaJ like chaperone protein